MIDRMKLRDRVHGPGVVPAAFLPGSLRWPFENFDLVEPFDVDLPQCPKSMRVLDTRADVGVPGRHSGRLTTPCAAPARKLLVVAVDRP